AEALGVAPEFSSWLVFKRSWPLCALMLEPASPLSTRPARDPRNDKDSDETCANYFRLRPSGFHGAIFTITTECGPTLALKLPVNEPNSLCAQRSRTLAERCPG